MSECVRCGSCCAAYRVEFAMYELVTVGGGVACAIYDRRPAPCHELREGSHACQKARARHGLPPTPDTPKP